MSLENVLSIADGQSSLSATIRKQIQGLTGDDCNVLQKTMDVPTLILEQVVKAMAVICNDLWNMVFSWCPMVGHSLFT